MSWTAADIPSQVGKTFVITGANGGLGFEATRALAKKGARIVMACRNLEKAEAAQARVVAETPHARLDVVALDLGDLASVRRAATEIATKCDRMDVLCNNAGVMAIPRRVTPSGFETHFATNHLGHFALTGLLLPKLLATTGARVVTVSSLMHQYGRMRFDDLQRERRYEKWTAYAQSKLANLLFAFELARLLERAGHPVLSVAAHPGYAATDLQGVGPNMTGSRLMKTLTTLGNRVIAQSAEMGGLPTLYAMTAPGVRSGEYFGPDGFRQLRGHPRRVGCHRRARNEEDARRLWDVSERLTGVSYASQGLVGPSVAKAAPRKTETDGP
jgi:NAD(P)-dependent dehydrogenase (short-subunit alcohol dehydrogenase family)